MAVVVVAAAENGYIERVTQVLASLLGTEHVGKLPQAGCGCRGRIIRVTADGTLGIGHDNDYRELGARRGHVSS